MNRRSFLSLLAGAIPAWVIPGRKRTRLAVTLPPIEENSDDWAKADALKNMEYLDADGMRKAYRNLTASFHCRERQLKEAIEKIEA